MNKPFIIITGMHRSGTSFLARALNLSGVYLGGLDSLFSHSLINYDDNPKGHWEHKKLLELAEKTLIQNNGSWDKIPEKIIVSENLQNEIKENLSSLQNFPSILSGYKDPRQIICFDSWRNFYPQKICIVGIFRHPLKVAESLKTRNNFSYEKSLLLWKEYNQRLLQILSKNDGFLLNFDLSKNDLLSDINFVQEKLGLLKNPMLDEWFSKDLLRSDETFDSNYTLTPDIQETYQNLLNYSKLNKTSNIKIKQSSENYKQSVYGLNQELQNLINYFGKLYEEKIKECDNLKSANNEKEGRLEHYYSHIEELRLIIKQKDLQIFNLSQKSND